MDDAVGVEKRERQSDVVGKVDLDVIGDWLWRAL